MKTPFLTLSTHCRAEDGGGEEKEGKKGIFPRSGWDSNLPQGEEMREGGKKGKEGEGGSIPNSSQSFTNKIDCLMGPECLKGKKKKRELYGFHSFSPTTAMRRKKGEREKRKRKKEGKGKLLRCCLTRSGRNGRGGEGGGGKKKKGKKKKHDLLLPNFPSPIRPAESTIWRKRGGEEKKRGEKRKVLRQEKSFKNGGKLKREEEKEEEKKVSS